MRWRKFKAGEFETRSNGAANERPTSEALRALPAIRRDDVLRALSGDEIRAQPVHACLGAALRNAYFQRRPGVEMPDFGGVDLMPARNLAGIEKIINQRRDGPPPRIPRRIAKGLTEKAALWMRLQIEQADDFGGGEAYNGIKRHFVFRHWE